MGPPSGAGTIAGLTTVDRDRPVGARSGSSGATVPLMSVEPQALSKRTELAGLVGEEATSKTHRAFRWQVAGVAVWVATFAILVGVDRLGTPALRYLAVILTVALLIIEGRAVQLYFQGGRAASVFLSHEAGSPIRVRGFSLQPRVWRKQISRSAGGRSQQKPAG